MLKKVKALVKDNTPVAHDIFKMTLYCPDADLRQFVPGQFAHISIPGHEELLLGRPFSISTADAAAKIVTIVIKIIGKGTKALAHCRKGAELSAILPVGRGFLLQDRDKSVFLIGGGVGIAPLLSVIQKWPDKQYEAFLGYRGRAYSYCTDDFSCCNAVHIASDDGTIGEHGLVTALLENHLKSNTPDLILSCGPTPMLCALKKLIEPLAIPCQVSVEERMCCGFGACAVCVCGVKTEQGLDYKKVCVEGPVFDLFKVVL